MHPVSTILLLDEAKGSVDLKAPVNPYGRVLEEKQGWLSQVRSEVPLLSGDDGNGVAYTSSGWKRSRAKNLRSVRFSGDSWRWSNYNLRMGIFSIYRRRWFQRIERVVANL